MSTETEKLARAAAAEREQLAYHLDQLQERLEKALDPRVIYERNPLAVLGAALVGGVILGAVTKGDRLPPHRFHAGDRHPRLDRASGPRGRMQNMGGALAAMVVSRLADLAYEFAASQLASRREGKRSPSRPAPTHSFADAEQHG